MHGLAGFLLATLCLGLCGGALALSPQRTITELHHTTWTAREGAPPNILALAQGRDGFLWIGSSDGLFRFDGVTFEKIPSIPNDRSRSDSVTALTVTRAGQVWAGFGWGGLATVESGRFRPIPFERLKERINRIIEAPDRTVWVETNRADAPLMRYRGGRWTALGHAVGVPENSLQSTLVDRGGTVWITDYEALSVMRPGASGFTKVEPISGQTALAEDRAGRVWIFDGAGVRRLADYAGGAPPNLKLRLPNPDSFKRSFAIIDRDGAFWGDDGRSGLIRLAPGRALWTKIPLPPSATAAAQARRPAPGRSPLTIEASSPQDGVETLTSSQGLTSDAAGPLLEDREGNIWLGTTAGLERFSATSLILARGVPITASDFHMLQADAAGVVVVSSSGGAFRFEPGQPVAKRWVPGDGESMCPGRPSGFWLLTAKEVLHEVGGRTERLPYPTEAGSVVQACAVDRLGALWMPGRHHGVFRLFNGVWSQLRPPGLDTRRHWITRAESDAQGRMLIFARFGGGLFRVDGLRSTPVAAGVDPGIGALSAMERIGEDIFLSGQFGIARLRGDRYAVLPADQYPWLRQARGIARSPSGEGWILSQSGIYRVYMKDLQAALDSPGRPIPHQLFDENDGIPGPIGETLEHPVVVGGDGRVWFDVSHAVVVLDPKRLVRNTTPPPVVIRALTVDGRRYSDPRDIRLPSAAANVQVDFTAPTLIASERVSFRYRLEGVDKDWIDPGARRQAFYTNLSPGRYRFQVIAANNDGVWNMQGATLALQLPPTFLQSWLFKLLCAAAAMIAAWLLYSLRMHQVAERVTQRLEARRAERERIARELHDTLLQGFQGLIFRFQAIARRIPETTQARPLLEQALNEADGVLAESRDRVRELRTPDTAANFSKVVTDTAERALLAPQTRLEVSISGAPRELHPIAAEEIRRIAEQAIQNVAQHADARNVEVRVTYERSRLCLSVEDDGVGVPADVLRRGGREGHFGLIGLRERANRIRGALTLESEVGVGTRVGLSVPASMAYAPGVRSPPRLGWPKWREART